MNEILWVEKYRPQTIKDAILPFELKQTFQQFVDNQSCPNLLLSGSAGCGKTTVAKAMLEELGCTYMMINGSEESGIDVLRNKIKNFASTVSMDGNRKYVILDEADQMMDLGFFPAIRRIMGFLPDVHQTLLLSATMPKQVRGLANEFLNNPIDVSIGQQSKPIEKINQKILLVDRPKKKQLLVEILTNVFKAIVFTRTKHGADKIVRYLREKGIDSTAIHGNKSQGQRQRSLDMFKKDRINILVATDIAARGIDIDEVSHVVNFDMPNIPESYVHRIGRTARAGNDGIAISLCDNSEVDYLKDIEKLINQKLPREKVLDDGSRKEVFYDPMDDRDPSLKIKKKNSRSKHRNKSLRGKGSKKFKPQLDKETDKNSIKSGKKKIKKKKNKKFYAKLEKVKNTNLSDEFAKDNSKKKSNNFKSSKQKKKTKSKKSFKDQPKANDRPRKK